VIAAFLLLYFGINIRFPDNHANKRHPRDPERAEECLNRNGVMYAFQEPTGQIHLICTASNKEFYDTIFKNRGAPDGTVDGITVFRANDYYYEGVYYEFNTVDDFAQHLVNVRGWTVLDPAQFQGPFHFIFP
jgi:hypothetical protein